MTKKEDESKIAGGSAGHDLSARRARLRTSLNKQPNNAEVYKEDGIIEPEEKNSMNEATTNFMTPSLSQAIENVGRPNAVESVMGQNEIIKVLSHIDQALNICVSHLGAMQNLAVKQIEDLGTIAQALQMQEGVSRSTDLSPLMESLTAAIEPMKAIGELVPALDRFVNTSENNEEIKSRLEINNDRLIVSLAEQLFAGHIGPSTFKTAYQTIFPEDDSTLLTQRLGDLLDAQQLSGELFQAAFQSLSDNQIADYSSQGANQLAIEAAMSDQEREEFVLKEQELSRLLLEKEAELATTREVLENRWNEVLAECEELKRALESQDEILQARENELNKKISELATKDSENQQLKTQIEEITDRTKEMMTDLQRQLAKKQEQEISGKQKVPANLQPEEGKAPSKSGQSAAQSGFFDFVNTGTANNSLFSNNAPSLLAGETDIVENGQTQVVPNDSQSTEISDWQPVDIKIPGRQTSADQQAAQSISASQQTVKAAIGNQLANDAQANTQASASFVSAVGSYGSGVRAQVFEVIVRQALAGTQWREICAVPMQSNNISPQEVEAEVKRRQALLKK